jgi:hypothetical protein
MDQADVEKVPDEHPSRYGQYNKYVKDVRFSKIGVGTLYDAGSGRVKAVAVDALTGLRVRFLDEVELIGRPPFEVASWFVDNREALGADLRINQCGDPSFDALGLGSRRQRTWRAVRLCRHARSSCGGRGRLRRLVGRDPAGQCDPRRRGPVRRVGIPPHR